MYGDDRHHGESARFSKNRPLPPLYLTVIIQISSNFNSYSEISRVLVRRLGNFFQISIKIYEKAYVHTCTCMLW